MFGGSSKTAKCKTQLKMVVSRIKIIRNKKQIQVNHLRRDVAQLLLNKQQANARTRVEHAIREQNMVAAYDIIEGYCDFLSARIQSLSGQKDCPSDLKEAVASLIYAGPRCADLPELLEIRSILTAKFGKQFIATIVELRVGCGVSKRIIEKLSSQPVSLEARLAFMTEAAREFKVNWKPEDLSLSLDEVKQQQQQQQPEAAPAPPAATAKPRPSVVTVPPNVKNTPHNVNSPKSPLASVRSDGAGYEANSELDDSDDEQVSPAPKPTHSAAPQQKHHHQQQQQRNNHHQPQQPQQQQQQQHQQKQQQQFIPFVGGPSKQAAGDPYSQYYSKGIVNPYVQKPGAAAKLENATTPPADPYTQYRKKFMANNPDASYMDVASAAEAAAESADQAAAAARAAVTLAHKHLSRESSMVDGDKVPVRKSTPVNLEDRVASYLQTHANDTDSSEWDSPLPRNETHRLNPSRNLEAEQKKVDMTRRSTGSNVTMGSERVPNHHVEKRMSLGGARANQEDYNGGFQRDNRREASPRSGKPVFDNEPSPNASRRPVYDDDFGAKPSRKWESEAREELHFQRPVYDEVVFDKKPSPKSEDLQRDSFNRRPVYDEDHGKKPSGTWNYDTWEQTREEKVPVYDDSPPTTAPAVGRVDSFAVHMESMNDNILARTEKLFEKEDSDASPVARRESRNFGGRVMQHKVEKEESFSSEEEDDVEKVSLKARKPSYGGKFDNDRGARFDTEVKPPSLRSETVELKSKDEERIERTVSKPPSRPPPPLTNVNTNVKHSNFQDRFQGSGVDYSETSSLASGRKPYKFGGASVRTKKT